jgi:para-nitrobenzyl esterase
MVLTAKTKYGLLRGVKKQDYSVFRGIPYAAPPVGKLRWKKPKTLQGWDGIREANSFPSRAWQMPHVEGTFYQKEFYNDEDFLPPMSEDCLYLNIWTPAETETDKLPVAFWIHGGAFSGGFNSEMEFDGEAFCRQGVILVTASYRVGALGFLTHPWLRDTEGRSGNYGLYDLAAALDWVHENIGAFGGDISCITVFGQSAGAMASQILVSSPLTKEKIHRSIFHSGGGYRFPLIRYPDASKMETWGEEFEKAAGVSSLEDLLALSPERVIEVQEPIFMKNMSSGVLPFGPHKDGVIITGDADEVLERGDHPDIPYLLGSTASDIGDPAEPGRLTLHEACIAFSELNEKLGRKPAWIYRFTQKLLGDESIAFHTAELWYVFGTLARSWRPKSAGDWELSSQMISYWCNFIKNGDLNGEGLPLWIAGRQFMELTIKE